MTSDEESRSGSTIPSDDDYCDYNNDDNVEVVDGKRKTQTTNLKVDSSSTPILRKNDEYAAEEEGARLLSLVDEAISLELMLLKEENKHKKEEEIIYDGNDISSELMLLLKKKEHTQ